MISVLITEDYPGINKDARTFKWWSEWAASHNGVIDVRYDNDKRGWFRYLDFKDEQDAVAFRLKCGV